MIAADEGQALELLAVDDLPFVTVRVDALMRPLERWNDRPSVDERVELDRAWSEHRREIEARVDAEVRQYRYERMVAAGLS